MSRPTPAFNNDSCLPVRNTVVDTLKIISEATTYNQTFVQKVEGWFSPTVAATYPILNNLGSQLIIPANSQILSAAIRSVGVATGGTSATIQDEIVNVFLAAQTLVNLNAGVISLPAVTSTGTVPSHLASLTVGTFPAGTRFYVQVCYLQLE